MFGTAKFLVHGQPVRKKSNRPAVGFLFKEMDIVFERFGRIFHRCEDAFEPRNGLAINGGVLLLTGDFQ